MKTVYKLEMLNQFDETIDSYGKEFQTYEEAENFLNSNSWMFNLKYEKWVVVECTMVTVGVGDSWGRGKVTREGSTISLKDR